MNIHQTLIFLIESAGRHPVTTDRGLTLAYHPSDNMITAGRPHDHPTPAENLDIAASLIEYLNLNTIAVGNRLGRTDHHLTKTKNGHQYYKPNLHITEFIWSNPKEKSQP